MRLVTRQATKFQSKLLFRHKFNYGLAIVISLSLITLLTPLLKKSFDPNLNQASAATPVITSITLNRGLIAGGNTVTINGSYLDSFSWKQTTADSTADHVCAITVYNTMYCWGRGDVGQIGNGATANRLIPTAVSQGAIAAGVTAKWLSVGGASNGSSCMLGQTIESIAGVVALMVN